MLFYSTNPASLGQLGILGRQVRKCQNKTAELKVKFLRPYGVAYLDQTMLYEKKRIKHLASTYPEVNQYLKQSGFKHLHPKSNCGKAFPQEDIIRVKRFIGSPCKVEAGVVRWLTSKVIPCVPMLSPRVHKQIVENLWEIVHNGLQHGEGEFGVSAAGQFYPLMGYFEVAFYDKGYGIPGRVKDAKVLREGSADSEAIEWAIQEGHSTQPIEEAS